MPTGTVKRVISERGFGFIVAPDGNEYFFHKDGLSSTLDFDRLVGGESVSFDVESGPKGPRAVRVQSA
jgi:CspA family cold shock protein